MKFDRKKFFAGFRASIDSTIEQAQVDGLEFLLGQIEKDPHWKDYRHIAYALATVYHETAGSFQPVEEGYYLGSKAKVKAFQKTLRYYPYYGRGYVQLTWETKRIPNYSKASKALGVDFVKHPDLVMKPEYAYQILTLGMHQGWFTGKKLTDYINDVQRDYRNARKIINGLDKAGLIAGYAKEFEDILRTSKTNSAAVHLSDPSLPPNGDSADDKGSTPVSAEHEPPPTMPASLVPLTTPVVEVEQVKAEEQPKEDALTRIGNKAVGLWTAAGATLTAIFSWAASTPLNLILIFVGAAVVVGLGWMIVNAIRANAAENRETVLKREREARAHEIQLLTLKSAADPTLQAVRVVPMPIANTDAPAEETV